MAKTILTISGPAGTQQTSLKPKGTVLGRGSNCDIILDHSNVSRLHARIFQDPFGRWIIEDLDSRNGVLVDGQHIKAHAISPGQKIFILPFLLSLSDEAIQQIAPGTPIRSTLSIIDKGSDESIVPYKTGKTPVLPPVLMQHLNEFSDRLLDLSSPSELYLQACLYLAEKLDTLVAIVRLPCKPQPLPDSPDILACHFGDSMIETATQQISNLHFSKRVLDAIRSNDTPVMASSWPSSDKSMMLTVVDKLNPHLVYSARVNDLGDTIDALYLDILESKSPKEMFDFIEAAARQINFIQKNLFLDELKKQEKALREAITQLKDKDRIKDEYVSRVTHDIKGHLASIQSCLYVLAGDSSGPLNNKQSDFLGRALSRTAQLTDFIKELLALTQMRLSGRLEMKNFPLVDSISKALDTVSQKAKDKSITLTSHVDPALGEIVGDEFSINEMITNLLFNAVKYTPEGRTIHLEAKCLDNHVKIDVIDTGIGIPADEVGNVFDEFFRATNAKKSERDGTGLGLSIVKQIVERHGGKISVQSQEAQGTTFTVKLPKSD